MMFNMLVDYVWIRAADEDDNGNDARHTGGAATGDDNMVLVLVRRCCLRRHACGEGAAGHCCRLGDCHPPPHRTGWGYEYEYDNGRGGRSPPLADTSKCSAERAIQMFNRLRWLRLQVAPEDKPEGRATVCGTIGSSPPSWRMPTLASGNAATPEFR